VRPVDLGLVAGRGLKALLGRPLLPAALADRARTLDIAAGRHHPEEASDWYARALEVAQGHGDVERQLARLRAPVPPALLLEYARPSADSEPQVALALLDALDHAPVRDRRVGLGDLQPLVRFVER